MITEPFRSRVIRYITDRRCPRGGYCFYRLDEPNTADTWYAIASLSLLGEPFRDEQTSRYLLDHLREDGSFSSPYTGYYVLKSLATLSLRPDVSPDPWIGSLTPAFEASERPPESMSYFETPYLYTDLCRTYGIPVPAPVKTRILREVLSHQSQDMGFGSGQSTLIETWHALAILSALGFDGREREALQFVALCEDPEVGFRAIPATRSSYLEHLHAGVLASTLLGYAPRVLPRCREIILQLQAGNGGFVRSRFGGSPTLEYTFLALRALDGIETLTGTNLRKPQGFVIRAVNGAGS